MCILWCIIGMPNMKVINIIVIEILQKRSNFDISLLGALRCLNLEICHLFTFKYEDYTCHMFKSVIGEPNQNDTEMFYNVLWMRGKVLRQVCKVSRHHFSLLCKVVGEQVGVEILGQVCKVSGHHFSLLCKVMGELYIFQLFRHFQTNVQKVIMIVWVS